MTAWTWILISQISPTRCTILLNIFISLLYMFRASMCPSSGKNYCIYATLVSVTLYGWRLVCWLDLISIQLQDQTPPIQSDKYQCRIDIVIYSWWWAHGCPKHVQKRNKYIEQNCAPSWDLFARLYKEARSTKHKILNPGQKYDALTLKHKFGAEDRKILGRTSRMYS